MARYRCGACGNLTRFEVVETTTTKSYYHYDVGGALEVQDTVVLEATVHTVACRWCGHGNDVEVLDDDGAAAARS